MINFTPKQIVNELNRFVIGQEKAKKAVAIALRNRWRRKNIKSEELKEEIIPHNILMVGPTGIGKTEIARRLAKMSKSPFIKIEATKFTEIGYVGRDVESIIRDLLDIALKMIREDSYKKVDKDALHRAKAKVVECLVGKSASDETKKNYWDKLESGILNEKEVEISISEPKEKQNTIPTFDIPGMPPGNQIGMLNIGDILNKNLGGKKSKLVTLKVADAINQLSKEEKDNLVDEEDMVAQAIKIVEEEGIVFLDEIDKISSGNTKQRNEANREGVQRDLLPLIEGTVVNTKYGTLKTDHILFIASGAFHLSRPSDLLPELQGRLPIRVQLDALSKTDLYKILAEPENSLPKQYKELFKTENVTLKFTTSGLKAIAEHAAYFNDEVENIGARRLYTLCEKVLENISFNAIEEAGKTISIDAKYVEKSLKSLNLNEDLSKFIL
ncbi:MAG: ATP-dependent HslUV protease ATP-binding subunit HslU [Candidatus Midichloriaceae bacterium]|jgi:ATP-dependent HslUV protease ATP-binding subunit HslU